MITQGFEDGPRRNVSLDDLNDFLSSLSDEELHLGFKSILNHPEFESGYTYLDSIRFGISEALRRYPKDSEWLVYSPFTYNDSDEVLLGTMSACIFDSMFLKSITLLRLAQRLADILFERWSSDHSPTFN